MHIAYTRSSSIFDDSRATKEILAFLENGFDVAVYGWDRGRNSADNCCGLFKNYEKRISLSFYEGKIGRGIIGKIKQRYMWNKWLRREIKKNESIDVIHACDYDTGAIVRKISRKRKIPYVYDIFDYYVDAHPVPRLLKGHVEKEEIRVINDSASTIICTEQRIEQIGESQPKNLVIIHNSPDVSTISEKPILYDYAYCGTMFGGRMIEEILKNYRANNHLKFVFAGNGAFAELAKDMAEIETNFSYLGAITYNEVLKVEAESRVLSAIYDPSKRNHRLSAPNKFYEALALGKPIIVCKGTGIDKVVQKHNIGIVINYSVGEFYKALVYLNNNSDLCREMGARARQIYEKEYRWSLMKERLIKIYYQFI